MSTESTFIICWQKTQVWCRMDNPPRFGTTQFWWLSAFLMVICTCKLQFHSTVSQQPGQRSFRTCQLSDTQRNWCYHKNIIRPNSDNLFYVHHHQYKCCYAGGWPVRCHYLNRLATVPKVSCPRPEGSKCHLIGELQFKSFIASPARLGRF